MSETCTIAELIRVDFKCGCGNDWTEVIPRSQLGRMQCPECKSGIGWPEDVWATSIDGADEPAERMSIVHTDGDPSGWGCFLMVVIMVMTFGFVWWLVK